MAEVDVGLPIDAPKTIQIQITGLEANATDARLALITASKSYRLGRFSGGYGFVVYELHLTKGFAAFQTREGGAATVAVGEEMVFNVTVFQVKGSDDPAAFRVSVTEGSAELLGDFVFVEGEVKKTDKKATEDTRTTDGVVEWIVAFPLKLV